MGAQLYVKIIKHYPLYQLYLRKYTGLNFQSRRKYVLTSIINLQSDKITEVGYVDKFH